MGLVAIVTYFGHRHISFRRDPAAASGSGAGPS